MHGKKHINEFRAIKLPVLAVYPLFFIVQIFFNFDTTPRPFDVQQNIVHISEYKTLHAETLKQGVNKTPKKIKVQLNKRYEPSSNLCVISTIAVAPVLYIEPLQIGSYTRAYYSSVILYTHSLRGPPVSV